jgi:hypothetical protein
MERKTKESASQQKQQPGLDEQRKGEMKHGSGGGQESAEAEKKGKHGEATSLKPAGLDLPGVNYRDFGYYQRDSVT